MPTLAIWQYFAAGAIFALGPILIHLLNRRRYRTIQWAAMDFLHQALQRNRRLLQLRDLLLLLLRVAVLFFFGLALAQPSCSRMDVAGSGNQPLHAVVIVDNTLSMAYAETSDSLLDVAKRRASDFLDQLPDGSRISIVPLAGSSKPFSRDAYATTDQAREAIANIESVDRGATIAEAVSLAKAACEAGPQLAKRIVMFTDQQRTLWEESSNLNLDDLPATLQVVEVAPAAPSENAWVAELRLDDGVADMETPARLVAVVRYEGVNKRENCKVYLEVAGQPAGEQTIDLAPGVTHDVVFKYEFREAKPEPGKPVFVPVVVKLSPDKLPADDSAHLMAPVVAGLPVVFVDQYRDDQENVARGRRGETRMIRRLLAPQLRGENDAAQLIKVRHVTVDDLAGAEGRKLLADARLVVMAGVEDPAPAVESLREYVRQGGPLFIATGGAFNATQWNSVAWNSGQGILPAPLLAEPLGALPQEAGDKLFTFQLANDSLLKSQSLFHIVDLDPAGRADLFADALFYKAVRLDPEPNVLRDAENLAVKQATEDDAFRAEAAERLRKSRERERTEKLSESDLTARRDDESRLRRLDPSWLTWQNESANAVELPPPGSPERAQAVADRAIAETRCRLLARYNTSNGEAFLVERTLGRGRIVFCTTGFLPEWNEVARTNAVLLFDRLLRDMIESTLPRRVFPVADRIFLPLPSANKQVSYGITRPDAKSATPLDVGFIGSDRFGAVITSPLQRGLYRIRETETAPSTSAEKNAADKDAANVLALHDAMDIAVNGHAPESDLRRFSKAEFDERGPSPKLSWIGAGGIIGIDGDVLQGRTLWRWLIGLVIVLLVVELLMLAWPVWRAEQNPAPVV